MEHFMRILIIEDELNSYKRLKSLLLRINKDFIISKQIASVKEAIKEIEENNDYNLIFSDIKLTDGLSFEIFEEVDINTPVIFITSYDQYALEAFKHNGIAYLLKPYSKTDLEEVLNKVSNINVTSEQICTLFKKEDKSKEQKNKILVNSNIGYIPVKIKDISFCKREGNLSILHMDNGECFSDMRFLNDLEDDLGSNFFRANRSYIINIDYISSIIPDKKGRSEVRIKDYPNEIIELSRSKTKAILEIF